MTPSLLCNKYSSPTKNSDHLPLTFARFRPIARQGSFLSVSMFVHLFFNIYLPQLPVLPIVICHYLIAVKIGIWQHITVRLKCQCQYYIYRPLIAEFLGRCQLAFYCLGTFPSPNQPTHSLSEKSHNLFVLNKF